MTVHPCLLKQSVLYSCHCYIHSASKAYIACLKGKTAEACDSSVTVVALATGVEARITNLGSTACGMLHHPVEYFHDTLSHNL